MKEPIPVEGDLFKTKRFGLVCLCGLALWAILILAGWGVWTLVTDLV